MSRVYTVTLHDDVTGARVLIVVTANTKDKARELARSDYHGRTGRASGYRTVEVAFTPEATP